MTAPLEPIASGNPLSGAEDTLPLVVTPELAPAPAPAGAAVGGVAQRRPRSASLRLRFAVAFVASLLVALAIGAGGIYAYDQQYADRVLPGVRVGGVDLSGLDRSAAADRLAQAFAGFSSGMLVLQSSVTSARLAFADFGRAPDVSAMVDEAMAVGHSGSIVDRALAETRTAIRGVTITPAVTLDAPRLLTRIQELLSAWDADPVDAGVVRRGSTFATTPAASGRAVDLAAVGHALTTGLLDPATTGELTVPVPVQTVGPSVDDAAAAAARSAAARMATDLSLVSGNDTWKIAGSTIAGWLSFGRRSDGTYGPIVDQVKLQAAVSKLARSIDRPARNASFLTSKSGKIFGVTASADGRSVDVAATSQTVLAALDARVAGQPAGQVAPVLASVKPKLTTEQARQAAPLMTKISSWTTYFPISERNSFGANIWIPALLINGTVVGPGETFDFWRTVGPVTTARGFGLGGAIINGHTDPQGAIGGGICSCSTTLFNAALRAGLKIDSRRNHFYYINRYPVGLDATVFISSGGARTTMSFTNDTPYPILIRGYKIRSGSRGYVRFELYSVPNGRTVKIGPPTIKNVTHAGDSIQYTSSLPKGTRQRIEVPTDGMDVWRTVTVYQNGKVLRQTTYYSHYARITGVLLVGTGS